MHVALGDVRQVEVDDVRDAVDVDAARGDVGRDEDARRAARKASSARSRAPCDLLPWMAAEPMPARSSCSDRRLAPCLVRVKTSARGRRVAEHVLEQRALVGLRDEDDRLLDALRPSSPRA